jgi:hypothetical protein
MNPAYFQTHYHACVWLISPIFFGQLSLKTTDFGNFSKIFCTFFVHCRECATLPMKVTN